MSQVLQQARVDHVEAAAVVGGDLARVPIEHAVKLMSTDSQSLLQEGPQVEVVGPLSILQVEHRREEGEQMDGDIWFAERLIKSVGRYPGLHVFHIVEDLLVVHGSVLRYELTVISVEEVHDKVAK